jgi:protocatechuate 3,4-dioxygenase beta subunit
MPSRITTVTFVVLAGIVAAAPRDAAGQVVVSGQTVGGGGVQGPGQGPARDRVPAQVGTAVIRGRVFAADNGRPLRRARITLTAPELGSENRTTSTNPEGRFEIKDLPAGRYSMTVARSGYLTLRYGQRRPLEQGKPLQILDKQLVDNVDFSLPRMSLITGRITDEVGEPVSGVQVWAMRSVYFEGRRKLVPMGGNLLTDDAGQYRLLGIVPGAYFLMATLRETWTVNESGVEQVMGYAPTYFPGTTSVGEAKRITVGIGQEASSIDFSLIPGRAAKISGTAVDSHGRPLAGQNVGLTQEFRGPNQASMFSSAGSPVGPDGTFTIKNVSPGEYKLVVRAATEGKIPGVQIQEAAAAPVAVNGIDIDNVTLVTSAGWSASGQVMDEHGGVPDIRRDRIRIVARSLNGDTDPRMGGNPDSGRVKDDWTFTVTNVFGQARLRVTLPDGWMVKAVMQGGRDIADTPIDLKSGEESSGLQVMITNKVTTVSGQLTDDKGAPITDGTVIVFADDAEKWSEDSRFVRSARPDQQGQYQVKGLPPGEYLAVAMDYVQEGMWNDPEYLESIRRYAQKFPLLDGASQGVVLKLVASDTR